MKNIIIIISDEHRRDAMGCMGHDLVKTPHLDQLAKGGTMFRRGYTASPMCVPTRAALATGTYVHQNKCWDSATPYDGRQPSWMHMLRDHGYHTASIGKLHFLAGADHGFTEEILPMHVHGPGWLVGLLRDELPDYDGASELAKDIGSGESSYTNYDLDITSATETWLADPARHDKPFAGFISLVSPHYPLVAPEDYYNMYEPDQMPVPPSFEHTHAEICNMAGFFNYHDHFDSNSAQQAIASYYGLTSFMDTCVGRIMKAVDSAGLRDDTLIIYTSDHGELLGDHGLWTKQFMFEASAGIPMILSGKNIPQNKISDQGVHLLDIPATILEIAGITKPMDWPGENLVNIANAPHDDLSRPCFSEYHDGGSTTGSFMVAWEHWKLIWYAGMEPLLFDLSHDPEEEHNLAHDPAYQAVLESGKAHLWQICDPEAVSQSALNDQKHKIESVGGREACINSFQFNATPIPEFNT